MENPNLPHEIMLEIFAKLPTKSVGKCTTLSKSWKTDLSTTNFINKHLITRQLAGQPDNFALVTLISKQLFIITSPTINDQAETGFPRSRYVLGSCNGLILLEDDRILMLLNPITRKMVKTIQPLVTLERCRHFRIRYSMVYGFGYDSCSDDYKIVKLESYLSNDGDDAKTFVDCYSVKTGLWKMLDDGCYPLGEFFPLHYTFKGGALINGAVHWLIGCDGGFPSTVAAFDLANESFREIPLPKDFVEQQGWVSLNIKRRKIGVSVVGGCLMIVYNSCNGVTDIWIMKEYGVTESWVKSRVVVEGMNMHSIVSTLGFIGDGELLCLSSTNNLCACDLKRGTVRKVVDFGEREKRNIVKGGSWFAHGIAFVDSLVSPEGSS